MGVYSLRILRESFLTKSFRDKHVLCDEVTQSIVVRRLFFMAERKRLLLGKKFTDSGYPTLICH